MFSSPTNHMKPLETLTLEAVTLCVAFKYISRLCETLLTYWFISAWQDSQSSFHEQGSMFQSLTPKLLDTLHLWVVSLTEMYTPTLDITMTFCFLLSVQYAWNQKCSYTPKKKKRVTPVHPKYKNYFFSYWRQRYNCYISGGVMLKNRGMYVEDFFFTAPRK